MEGISGLTFLLSEVCGAVALFRLSKYILVFQQNTLDLLRVEGVPWERAVG